MNGRAQSRGATMIELLIAIMILAILLGLAVPSFRIWLQNLQIRNAAEAVQNGLQRARGEAVARNANVEFVLGADSSWVVQIAGGATIESRPASEGSRDVTVTATPFGATTVTFNSLGGIRANADASATLTQVELDSSRLTAAESWELRVTVGVGGNVRMCDPHIPASNPRGC